MLSTKFFDFYRNDATKQLHVPHAPTLPNAPTTLPHATPSTRSLQQHEFQVLHSVSKSTFCSKIKVATTWISGAPWVDLATPDPQPHDDPVHLPPFVHWGQDHVLQIDNVSTLNQPWPDLVPNRYPYPNPNLVALEGVGVVVAAIMVPEGVHLVVLHLAIVLIMEWYLCNKVVFSTNFCFIKIDLSGNTVWPQALGF